MTMPDNNLLSYNKIKRFGTNHREGSRKDNTSKCKVILEIGSATIYHSDQIDINDHATQECCDSICAECGNDHSFQPDFERVMTSINVIQKIFPGLFYNAGEIH
jgi:hypothetical protein